MCVIFVTIVSSVLHHEIYKVMLRNNFPLFKIQSKLAVFASIQDKA